MDALMGHHTIQKVINEVQAFEAFESIWNDSDDVIETNFSRVDFAEASGVLILSTGLRTLRFNRPEVQISVSESTWGLSLDPSPTKHGLL
jgi:hypothetical protein